ncbi:EamA family transporter RarD [Phaeovulum sp.]|uniref:EamA family transporter RarD n=1 Tax=Phaeovulum sp. TaxID=2934796 RepID=UPI0039E6B82B
MSEAAKGFWALVVCCLIWGLSSIYYKALMHVPPLEVLSHRTIWSLVFFGAVLALQGRLGVLWQALRGRGVLMLAFSAVMVSLNWFLFIFSVQSGQAMEASLGYYIFPLVAVMIGVVGFRERLRPVQVMAVVLAGSGVFVLTWGLGAAPWIALGLAFSFGLYGMMKKWLAVGPVVSVTAEVALLTPLAVIWLAGVYGGWWAQDEPGGWFGRDLRTSVMLAFSGLLTGGPLMLFSYAARRVQMATVGLVQYLNPTLQFTVAALVFGEPFTIWHRAAFGMIWAALALYSWVTFRQPKALSSAASSAPTSGTGIR